MFAHDRGRERLHPPVTRPDLGHEDDGIGLFRWGFDPKAEILPPAIADKDRKAIQNGLFDCHHAI